MSEEPKSTVFDTFETESLCQGRCVKKELITGGSKVFHFWFCIKVPNIVISKNTPLLWNSHSNSKGSNEISSGDTVNIDPCNNYFLPRLLCTYFIYREFPNSWALRYDFQYNSMNEVVRIARSASWCDRPNINMSTTS